MDIIDGLPKLTHKIVQDYDKLTKFTDALKDLNQKVVVTIGTWDMLHIGHVRYLNKARHHGDVLLVGVDSDRSVKSYKGPLRPIIPENERVEMLSYQSCVDLVTVIDDVDKQGKWNYELIKKVRPDVFVAVEDSYPESQLADIRKYCGEVVVLPRQAENTSTSKLIQTTLKKHLLEMLSAIDAR